MAGRTRYVVGPDVPDDEVLRDSKDRVVDDAYIDGAVEDALSKARGRGRPSPSKSGESPLLRVRISAELDEAVSHAAEAAGETRAEWVRRVLTQALRRTG